MGVRSRDPTTPRPRKGHSCRNFSQLALEFLRGHGHSNITQLAGVEGVSDIYVSQLLLHPISGKSILLVKCHRLLIA
jgi:hypothetical protein